MRKEKGNTSYCLRCGAKIEEGLKYCAKCDPQANRRRGKAIEAQEPEPSEALKCISCGARMKPLGTYSFKPEGTLGTAGAIALFGWIGALYEATKDVMTFDLHVCPKCRRIEWLVPAPWTPRKIDMRYTPKGFVKNCIKCGENIPIASEECQYCGAQQKPSKK